MSHKTDDTDCGRVRQSRTDRGARRRGERARLRGADAGPARDDSAADRRDATCSGRRRPAPARPPPSRCRCCSASAEDADGEAADRRPRARADARAGDAGRRSDPQVRQGPRRHASLPVYGGAPISQQIRTLERGAGIVVATPGRALDHIKRGTLKLDHLRVLVLDEADEMLDMGFAEDLDAILEATPKTRQTALFSATMPARILAIAQRHLNNPARVTIAREKTAAGKLPRVRQIAYIVPRAHKPAALDRVLDMENPTSAHRVLPHAPRGRDARRDAERARPPRAGAARRHGAAAARSRDAACSAAAKADLLVATDVAARGLDIEHLSHVVNYDVPAGGGGLRAPHRPHRPRRPRRHRDHAGRAARAPAAAQHRELHQAEDRGRHGADRRRAARAAARRDARLDPRADPRRRPRRCAGGRRTLAQEFDIVDIAAAAVKLAHAAEAGDEAEREIPVVARRAAGAARLRSRERDGSRDSAFSERRGRRPGRAARAAPRRGRARGRTEDVARLFIGAGREAGIRPGDLVGAITGEAGINSRELGAIEIADRFSLIEVPESRADDIIAALRATTIRGRKVTVRRDRASQG